MRDPRRDDPEDYDYDLVPPGGWPDPIDLRDEDCYCRAFARCLPCMDRDALERERDAA